MRMWLTNPKDLCRQHLLSEHNELHTLIGSIRKGHTAVLHGLARAGYIDTTRIRQRHKELVAEFKRRGYNHKSPLPKFKDPKLGNVDIEKGMNDRLKRCSECRKLYNANP